MDFYEIFVRSPVNGSARQMLSYSNNLEKEISTDEIKELIERLERKRRLLNNAIGVKTKAQRKNLKWKMNKGLKNRRFKHNSRVVIEWCRNGDAIEKLKRELQSRKLEG